MTTFWPKRDEDGRHIVERARADVAKDLKCAKCNDTGLAENTLRRMDGQTITVLCPCECQE